ncbi:hypothetical protein JF539_23925 [Labrenzia aggregata]|uniref:Uncharacterized protein n=1 Tax=Roseibium aggregatum TaxID=187304 RepID=A0A939EI73_9HYPH|nr:hypothetical protein [Roseibium aggregatum]
MSGLLFSLVLIFVASGANAADITSAYTKIDFDACVEVSPADLEEGTSGGSVECRGYQGQTVFVAEGDLRMFVSFGPHADDEPASRQTLPNFNTVNDTLEWRLRGGVPFATILRWFPSYPDGVGTGSVLIVTQLRPGGGTCQIARIDAQANKNANILARQAADSMAGNFDCSQQPAVLGTPGILN